MYIFVLVCLGFYNKVPLINNRLTSKQQKFIATILESGKSKIKEPAWSCFGEDRFLVHSQSLLTVWKE